MLLPKLAQMDAEGRSLEQRSEVINKVFYDAATHEHIANVTTMLKKVRDVDVNMVSGPKDEPIVMQCRRMNNRSNFQDFSHITHLMFHACTELNWLNF